MKHSKKDRVECTCGEIYANPTFLSQHINDELQAENKALKEKSLKDYEKAIKKFDECRGCLARIAEKLGIELPNEAPNGIYEWHEHLIYKLDKYILKEKESR